MGSTDQLDLPYPDPTDANNVPADIEALADRVEQVLLERYIQSTDARLANARTPNGPAGGALAGFYPNPSFADGAIASSSKFASPLVDGTAGTAGLRSLGTGPQQAAAGNHNHGTVLGDSGWQAIEALTYFDPALDPTPSILNLNGWVSLRGIIQYNAMQVTNLFARIPAAFRPDKLHWSDARFYRGGDNPLAGSVTITVNPTGEMRHSGTSGPLSSDGTSPVLYLSSITPWPKRAA